MTTIYLIEETISEYDYGNGTMVDTARLSEDHPVYRSQADTQEAADAANIAEADRLYARHQTQAANRNAKMAQKREALAAAEATGNPALVQAASFTDFGDATPLSRSEFDKTREARPEVSYAVIERELV